MKIKMKNIGLGLLLAASALFTVPSAKAYQFVTQDIALAPSLVNVVNGTSNSLTGATFLVPQNVPWSLVITNNLTGYAAGPSNTTYYIRFSPDGTTWGPTN